MPDIEITSIDIEACKHLARNSKKLLEMEQRYARAILRIIKKTAPQAMPTSEYAYKSNFRIENRLFPLKEGHVTYIIAERFQWRWIEYGWTEWQSNKKYKGKHVMSNALKSYAYGDSYGVGVK